MRSITSCLSDLCFLQLCPTWWHVPQRFVNIALPGSLLATVAACVCAVTTCHGRSATIIETKMIDFITTARNGYPDNAGLGRSRVL